MQKTLENIRDITESAENIVRFVEKQTSKALIEQTLQKLLETLENIDQLSKSFRKDFHRIEYNFRKTSETLDATLRSIQRLSDYLERDPSSVIRGRTGQ